jgi:ankyrin repeat protein
MRSRKLLGPILAVTIALLVSVSQVHASGDIFEAARMGTAQDVEKLLVANKNLINARTELGSTPLHLAATNPNSEVAKMLLARGADINARDNNNTTPLHLAAYTGKKELVEFFLSKGADAHARDFKNETPRDKAHFALNHEIKGILVMWMLKNPPPPAKKK